MLKFLGKKLTYTPIHTRTEDFKVRPHGSPKSVLLEWVVVMVPYDFSLKKTKDKKQINKQMKKPASFTL